VLQPLGTFVLRGGADFRAPVALGDFSLIDLPPICRQSARGGIGRRPPRRAATERFAAIR